MIGFGKTDKGLIRENNEDSIFISNEKYGCLPNLYIVSDGMGGHKAGEIASKMAIESFMEFVKKHNADLSEDDYLDFMVEAVFYANKKVYDLSSSNNSFSGMGATFSACMIYSNKLYSVHLGDSRIYILNTNTISQITNDHTYVNELVKAGQITQEQAKVHPGKNMITRAIGSEEGVLVDGIVTELNNDDYILICSDGLNNMMTDDEIKKNVITTSTMQSKCDNLVDLAKEYGGKDNISVVLIYFCAVENEVIK